MSVKGKGARDKGSRAERKWRNELRRIYPPELRNKVQRVPMSGAGYIKGDIADLNDTDTCYEVKNQEQLHIPDWWRQAVSQAGSSRTPVLVVTQNYAPFYVIMRVTDWNSIFQTNPLCILQDTPKKVGTGKTFFSDMASLEDNVYTGKIEVDGEILNVIPSELYIKTKIDIYQHGVV